MNIYSQQQIREAIAYWTNKLQHLDESERNDMTKFLKAKKDIIAKGIVYIDSHFLKNDFKTSLASVDGSMRVIPTKDWTENKTDPTETTSRKYSETGKSYVRVREDYLAQNKGFNDFKDKFGWAYHELVHTAIFNGKMPEQFIKIDSPFGYPLNTDEIYAFGFQIYKTIGKPACQNMFDYEKFFRRQLEMLKNIVIQPMLV